MKTPRVKLVPPRLPASHVRRPALERLLEEAERRRLTSIVAGPGFGKSTLTASVATERGWRWYLVDGGDRSVTSFARGLADALELDVGEEDFGGGEGTARAQDLAAVLTQALEDETTEANRCSSSTTSTSSAPRARASFCSRASLRQAPPEVHFVLSSRDEPPFRVQRLRGQGQVLDVDASMLTFTGDEVAGVVGAELGDAIHELTAGWPAAVQLTAEMLQSRTRRGSRGSSRRARPTRRASRLLPCAGGTRTGARRGRARCCGRVRVRPIQRRAVRGGGRVPARRAAVGAPASRVDRGARRSRRMADAPRRAARFPPDEPPAVGARSRDRACESRGLVFLSRVCCERVRLPEGRAEAGADRRRIPRDHWRELYDQGLADAVVDAAGLLPASLIDEGLRHLIGRSYALLGQHRARRLHGSRRFRLAPIGRSSTQTSTSTAASSRGVRCPGGGVERYPGIRTLADLHRVRGAGARRARSRRARGAASARAGGGGRRPRAPGRCACGRRRHRAGAWRHGRGGTTLPGRMRACRAWRKLARTLRSPGEARSPVDHVWALPRGFPLVETAIETGRPHQLRGHAHRGTAPARLALCPSWSLRRSRRRAGGGGRSRRGAGVSTAWDSVAHGDFYVERGDVARARIAYRRGAGRRRTPERQDAIDRARRGWHKHSPTTTRTLPPSSPPRPWSERERAPLPPPHRGMGRAAPRRARTRGRCSPRQGRKRPRRRGARPAVAESLELRAFCSGAPDTALLEEALALRRDLGEPVAAARIELGARAHLRREARRGAHRARAAGARLPRHGGRGAGILMAAGAMAPTPLTLQTLGGFRVLRHGSPVPAEAWKSKKARDLLKILAARRGNPVARDQLIEALWPRRIPSTHRATGSPSLSARPIGSRSRAGAAPGPLRRGHGRRDTAFARSRRARRRVVPRDRASRAPRRRSDCRRRRCRC